MATSGVSRPLRCKDYARLNLRDWSYRTLKAFCTELVKRAALNDEEKVKAIEVLTYLNDARLPMGDKKRAWTLNIIREHLTKIFKATPRLKDNAGGLVRPHRLGVPESRSGRRRATKRSW